MNQIFPENDGRPPFLLNLHQYMKYIIFNNKLFFMRTLIIFLSLAFTMCCKKTETSSLDAELAKLPPITQTGANTFGCLVNGKAVTPNSNCLGCPPPICSL